MRFCTEVQRMMRGILPRRISEAASRTEPQTKFGAWLSCEGPSRLMAQLVIIEKAANNIEMPIMAKEGDQSSEKLAKDEKFTLCTCLLALTHLLSFARDSAGVDTADAPRWPLSARWKGACGALVRYCSGGELVGVCRWCPGQEKGPRSGSFFFLEHGFLRSAGRGRKGRHQPCGIRRCRRPRSCSPNPEQP